MQFIIIAHDGKDKGALARRLAAREQHIALCDESLKTGTQLFGVAILDDAEKMCGSVMIVEYPSRKEVDAWLAREPYVTGKVWEKVEVQPCKVGPSFEHLVKG